MFFFLSCRLNVSGYRSKFAFHLPCLCSLSTFGCSLPIDVSLIDSYFYSKLTTASKVTERGKRADIHRHDGNSPLLTRKKEKKKVKTKQTIRLYLWYCFLLLLLCSNNNERESHSARNGKMFITHIIIIILCFYHQ